MNIEEIKNFVYEVRTFGITSNDTKFVQITEYLLSELEKEKENNKKLQDKCKELIFEKQELTSALLDSTPNDKIKAKIEELDKEYTEILKDYGNIDEDVIFQIENENVRKQLGEILSKIIVLQSLLEKE